MKKYQYCGPGTKLAKRLKRNDPGINKLDSACKEHDIAYEQTTDVAKRNRADDILARKAWDRVKSSDASVGERATALGIAGIMKTKSKLGMGLRRRRKKKTSKRLKRKISKTSVSGLKRGRRRRRRRVVKRKSTKKKRSVKNVKKIFRQAVKDAKQQIASDKPASFNDAAKIAFSAAKRAVKLNGRIPRKDVMGKLPRVIPVPKIGGVLPLIPIFAGLSALGALTGGSAGIANAVINASDAKKRLGEAQRHNETMEAIALGKMPKTGKGLFLSPYKKGFGLFITPYDTPKN